MTRLFALIVSALTVVRANLGASPRLAAHRRAITMLEWVLIATVAVILFALLRDNLRSIFESLISRIGGAVTSD